MNPLPTITRGRPESRASRLRRRGFTLIELIIVMALLLIVVGVSFPSLKNFFKGRTLDSEARRFLSLTRYAQSRAASEGLPMVLWIDAQERTYGLQVETGYLADLDRKAVEYELDEGLAVEVSAPPTGELLSQRKRTAVQNANLPAIRISAEGYIGETSPETVVFRQEEFGDEHNLWVTQSGNRLQYEISATAPVNYRRR
jgi:prepilin-type N-terminal cleavage/methylation domain-containing protein